MRGLGQWEQCQKNFSWINYLIRQFGVVFDTGNVRIVLHN